MFSWIDSFPWHSRERHLKDTKNLYNITVIAFSLYASAKILYVKKTYIIAITNNLLL